MMIATIGIVTLLVIFVWSVLLQIVVTMAMNVQGMVYVVVEFAELVILWWTGLHAQMICSGAIRMRYVLPEFVWES